MLPREREEWFCYCQPVVSYLQPCSRMGNGTKETCKDKCGSKMLILREGSKINIVYLKKSKQGGCKSFCKYIRIEEAVRKSS